MRRFPMIIAAGVTTAIIVLGMNALTPVGAQETGEQAASPIVERFARCMRDRGIDVPALRGDALERWLKRADLPIDDARACKTALADVVEKAAPTADARKLATCLRAHGLNPPAAPEALKAWMVRQDKAVIEEALEDCGASGPEPACGERKDE